MFEITQEIKRRLWEVGYTLFAPLLVKLVAGKQYNIVGLIIAALCLLERRTEIENNGVLSVLKNGKLEQAINLEVIDAIERWAKVFVGNYDKIVATLESCWWYIHWTGNRSKFVHMQPVLTIYADNALYHLPVREPGERSKVVDLYIASPVYDFTNAVSVRISYQHDGPDGVLVAVAFQRSMSDDFHRLGNAWYGYRIPSETVLAGFDPLNNGRRICDALELGHWYDCRLRGFADEPDFVDNR
jgi:hypothetical protein